MNNKNYLPLFELIVMIGVFALAAALCLQGFAFAENISLHLEAKDRAVAIAENAAEELKHAKGDTGLLVSRFGGEANGDVWRNYYGADGSLADKDEAVFILEAHVHHEAPLLGNADVKILHEGKSVFELTVGWQED